MTQLSNIISRLQQNGIQYAQLVILERDWLDTPERPHTVRFYADGRVTVDDWEITHDDLKQYWHGVCQRHYLATGERATLVPAQPQEIGRLEAHALHVTLGERGIRDHSAFCEGILGRAVPHLRHLTPGEARRVREVAVLIPARVATKAA